MSRTAPGPPLVEPVETTIWLVGWSELSIGVVDVRGAHRAVPHALVRHAVSGSTVVVAISRSADCITVSAADGCARRQRNVGEFPSTAREFSTETVSGRCLNSPMTSQPNRPQRAPRDTVFRLSWPGCAARSARWPDTVGGPTPGRADGHRRRDRGTQVHPGRGRSSAWSASSKPPDAVKAAGWASTQDFLTAVTGGHKGTGPAIVRLATAVAEPVLAPVGRGPRRRVALHPQGPGHRTRHRRPARRPRPARPRCPGPARRGQGARRHRAAASSPAACSTVVDPDGRGPPRRTRPRPARTRRPPRPVPDHHRRPGRRRLDQRPLHHRGRRGHQGHPDPTRRTPPQPPDPVCDPATCTSPGAATTAATPATTAPGCSTP